ncbi:MAG TPA: FecR family protein [Candidatus Dormibacteraeota bacterium]|nr:FecR family protein [Candidatus Dormibacteraeota bacterium]
MRKHSRFAFGLAFLLCFAIVVPVDLLSQNASGGQRAGEVSKLIPAVGIQRSSQTLTAAAKTPIQWEDLLSTQTGGRARVALDDGSVLNVGSETSLRVVKHDGGAQQTDLELTYGRLRSQVPKIAKPGGKFEVRTPAGVAGVVGTDFYLAYANGVMQLIVFQGTVHFCTLMGQCVDVTEGLSSTARINDAQPSAPEKPTPEMLTDATISTAIGRSMRGTGTPHHFTTLQIVGIVAAVAIPAIVIPIAVRKSRPTQIDPCVLNPRLPQCQKG